MSQLSPPSCFAIVGRGRLGRALTARLQRKGHRVIGPLTRRYDACDLRDAQIVLLCVPDREIAAAAQTLSQRLTDGLPCPPVGHCSGATPLSALDPLGSAQRFSLHPLMSFSGVEEVAPQTDGRLSTGAAICGGSPEALHLARALAHELGFEPFVITEADRAAYHAAASMASNFLITLQAAAERLAVSAGCERDALVPLVRQTVENWAAQGPAALTGPIARGDHATVASQRAAVLDRTPQLLGLFDALAQATTELAGAGIDRGPRPHEASVVGRAA